MSKVSIADPRVRVRPADRLTAFLAQSLQADELGALPENVRSVSKLFGGVEAKANVDGSSLETLVKPTLSASDLEFLRELNAAANAEAASQDGDSQSTSKRPLQLSDILTVGSDEEDNEAADESTDHEDDDESTNADKPLSKSRSKRLKEQQRERARARARLSLDDLIALDAVLQRRRTNADGSGEPVPWLHELLSGSALVLPANEIRERDAALEARCVRLRLEQDARVYNAMTKNVDSSRRQLPDETIAYQMKAINRQLIAVAQFLFSVAAGFAFGFIGVELMIGGLDFGFRLLLGIICALVIALAEIYFLAKHLNEEYDVSVTANEVQLKSGKSTSAVAAATTATAAAVAAASAATSSTATKSPKATAKSTNKKPHAD